MGQISMKIIRLPGSVLGENQQLGRMLQPKPPMLAASALANKMARGI
jgi:hypothetical protein